MYRTVLLRWIAVQAVHTVAVRSAGLRLCLSFGNCIARYWSSVSHFLGLNESQWSAGRGAVALLGKLCKLCRSLFWFPRAPTCGWREVAGRSSKELALLSRSRRAPLGRPSLIVPREMKKKEKKKQNVRKGRCSGESEGLVQDSAARVGLSPMRFKRVLLKTETHIISDESILGFAKGCWRW